MVLEAAYGEGGQGVNRMLQLQHYQPAENFPQVLTGPKKGVRAVTECESEIEGRV